MRRFPLLLALVAVVSVLLAPGGEAFAASKTASHTSASGGKKAKAAPKAKAKPKAKPAQTHPAPAPAAHAQKAHPGRTVARWRPAKQH